MNGDYLYEDLYLRSWDLATGIRDLLGHDVTSARVCLFCPGSMSHVMGVWATWMAGHVAVPLCPSSDQARLEHVIMDTKADLVITTVDQVNAACREKFKLACRKFCRLAITQFYYFAG